MATHPDVAVLGGGVIGLSVARRLARDGLSVGIFERGVCGGEASWAGAGVLAPCNPHRRDAIARLRDQSLSLYPAYCAALLEESGIDPQYEPCGELEIALHADSLRSLQENAQAGKQEVRQGRPAYRFLSTHEARGVEPALSADILGALECNRTAQVRNPRLLQALVGACRRAGVAIHEQTEVREVVAKNGRVTGVQTDQGEVSSRFVVLCAGAWSGQFPGLGEMVPVGPVRGQMLLLKFDQRPFQRVIARGKTYLVPRRDGHVLLGATEEHDGSFSKRNTAAGVGSLMQTAIKLVPAVAQGAIVTQWAGLRPGTPDDAPLIGPVPGFEGLIAATGHFRAGLILAPITAEIVSATIQGKSGSFDLDGCLPGRIRAEKSR